MSEAGHSHVFLGSGHEHNERKTWLVIWICGAMMILEMVGGTIFGSIALVADGLHMSTHAGAMLLAALAYTYSRKRADDRRYTFGTGKFGDLAGFTSAIILAMIALLIGYEGVSRLLNPVPIHFREAIPIAALGLVVNIVSGLILSSGDHHHGHGHDHSHDHSHHHEPAVEEAEHEQEHGHADAHRDHNLRAAVVHVMADAAVSVLVIVGLLLARSFGWLWMDPLAGMVGAVVIASWSFTLIRDTGAILLDVNPDPSLSAKVQKELETDGDLVTDFHLWRLGPGHFGAIVSVQTPRGHSLSHYRSKLARFPSLSHVTVEILNVP